MLQLGHGRSRGGGGGEEVREGGVERDEGEEVREGGVGREEGEGGGGRVGRGEEREGE